MNRRHFLKGGSALLALPLLQSSLLAKESAKKPPTRMIFIGYGYGPTFDWFPDIKQIGKNYALTNALKPLEKFKSDFSVVSGLAHLNHTAVHSSCETFLTGADTKRTPGRAFHNDISVDQVAALHLGKGNRFSTLALSDAQTTGCGTGASLSWDQVGNPVMGIQDPIKLYDYLFGGGLIPIKKKKEMLADRRSILDAVLQEANSMKNKVSSSDKDKMEEYFTSIRSLENRLSKEVQWVDTPPPKVRITRPKSRLQGTAKYEVMFDMIATAFQTDLTRISTLRIGSDELLNEANKELGYRMGGHVMSHYKESGGFELEASRLRDLKHSRILAYLIDKLKKTTDVNGSNLLDNTIIVMGSGVRTHHNLRNLPIIVAGHGGKLKQGQHIYQKDGHLSNLFLTLLQAAGVPASSFSDSNDTINGLI